MNKQKDYLDRLAQNRAEKIAEPRSRRPGRHRRPGRPKGAYGISSRAYSRRGSLYEQFLELPKAIKNTVLSIFLIAFAILIILSLIDLAGRAGILIAEYFGLIFGVGIWLLPFLMLILGYFLIRAKKYEVTKITYIGFAVLMLTFTALIHLLKYSDSLWQSAKDGLGGGLLGLILSWPSFQLLGFWASLIIIIALLIISLFLFFKTSADQLGGYLAAAKNLASGIKNFIIKRRLASIQNDDAPIQQPLPEFSSKEIEVEMELEASSAAANNSSAPENETADDDTKEFAKAIKKPHRRIDLPLNLLNGKAGEPTSGDIKGNQLVIQKTLQNFGIDAEMGEINIGPTVTQYTLKPAEGVKLSRITSLSDNLALALAAHPIRIEAPIPNKSLVGVEVPNRKTAIVPLREVLDCPEFHHRESNLLLALGKDVKGSPHLINLIKLPHLLICGSTGSGKSVCVNAIILSLLFQNGPDELKFIMVDPKRVELPLYNGIPHLLTPVITDVKKTINALKWAIAEMENRFNILMEAHRRDIQSYNASVPEKMSYIIVVIDELADLMAAAGPEIEACVIRLAQMARAVGIHLVIATQRPSVDVLTGLIKANIPARIAFSVASLIDSRTILDASGAEKLLGRGDMLYLTDENSKHRRLKGAYASDE